MKIESICTVINNNQPGWTNIVETAPNVTLDVGEKLYRQRDVKLLVSAANELQSHTADILAAMQSDSEQALRNALDALDTFVERTRPTDPTAGGRDG